MCVYFSSTPIKQSEKEVETVKSMFVKSKVTFVILVKSYRRSPSMTYWWPCESFFFFTRPCTELCPPLLRAATQCVGVQPAFLFPGECLQIRGMQLRDQLHPRWHSGCCTDTSDITWGNETLTLNTPPTWMTGDELYIYSQERPRSSRKTFHFILMVLYMLIVLIV